MDVFSYLMGKKAGGGGSVPEYEGSYSVTPSESAQTLATKDKKCTDDISVGAISSTYIGSGVTQKAAATYTPTTSDQTIAANQYLSGAQTVKGDANLVAGNIKKDVQMFGVTGTYEGSGGGGDWVEPTGNPVLKLYIEVPYDNLEVWLHLASAGTGAYVDWGDGSETTALESVSVSAQYAQALPKKHTYNHAGKYVIAAYSTNYLVKTHDVSLWGGGPQNGTNGIVGIGKYNGSMEGGVSKIGITALPLLRKVYQAGNYLLPISYCKWQFETLLAEYDGSVYVGNESDPMFPVSSYMFAYSGVKYIRIRYGKYIETGSFLYCSLLHTVSIGDSVLIISTQAFKNCSNLRTVIFNRTTPPSIGNSDAFSGINADCHFEIPYDSVAYLTATNYPSPSTYKYIGFKWTTAQETLPTQDTSQAYNLTWYANENDALSEVNPITEGNGDYVFCRYTAVS